MQRSGRGRGRGRGSGSRGRSGHPSRGFAPRSNQFNQEQQKWLHDFAGTRYDPNTGVLNFSGLSSVTQPLTFNMNDKKFVEDFLNSIQNRDNLTNIVFANNGITNMMPYKNLGKIFRNLREVNFDNNQIQNISEFMLLSSCTKLEKLSMRGNPCENQAPNLVLPSLKFVNDQPCNTIQLPTQQITLPRMVNSNIDSKVKDVIIAFVTKFIPIFEARQDLTAVYDKNAIFSYTITSNHNCQSTNENVNDLNELRKRSHDIKFNQQLIPTVGSKGILNMFSQLPPFNHNMNSMTVDAELLDNEKIILSIHGEIHLNGMIRCFDRTFVLTTPNQAASQAGWPVVILNDQLHIFSNTNRTGLTYDPLIQRLSQETGLTENYARECLEKSNMDYNQALVLFQNHKSSLPQEAFKFNR